ncbi:hypothetical protein NDU88_007332 [Pleurodeles waltl]|uniref:Uncharacterized protein n=1 Tax=Pleurodeles waltl TaxID=8319 RepID=A0AAV7VSB4_PLEWA|nr:hypothetical protein NDU88_007332 [Pleurodeles waltl]
MCAPRFSGAEPGWRAAEAVWWRRAALELRRVRKGVARIPLRGNSGSGGRNSGSGVAAAEKIRQGAQLKETAVKEPRRNKPGRRTHPWRPPDTTSLTSWKPIGFRVLGVLGALETVSLPHSSASWERLGAHSASDSNAPSLRLRFSRRA